MINQTLLGVKRLLNFRFISWIWLCRYSCSYVSALHTGVIASGIFLASIYVGADAMSRSMNVPTYLADVILHYSFIRFSKFNNQPIQISFLRAKQMILEFFEIFFTAGFWYFPG